MLPGPRTSLLSLLIPSGCSGHDLILISSQALHHTSPASPTGSLSVCVLISGAAWALGTTAETGTSWHNALGGHTHVLTDKSGRLFKSIKDCANTTIRGLLALISPEAGAIRELATLAVKMGGSCGNPGPRQGSEVVTCWIAHSWAHYRVVHHPWPVWLHSYRAYVRASV